MNRISPITEKRIVELWFQGWPRDQIAHKLYVSGSTVSKIVHLLPESLKEYRSLSVELRKHDLSPSEAKEGAKLVSKLDQLGVPLDDLESYIEVSTTRAQEECYAPAQVVKGTMTLWKLEAEAGKPYSAALEEYERRLKRSKRLKAKNRKLEAERKQKLAQNKVTEHEIEYITELRRKLHAYGVDLADTETLQRYLRNMQETNGDPTKFTEYTRKHRSVKKRLAVLEIQVEARNQTHQNLQHKVEICKTEINRYSATLSRLKEEIHKAEEHLETLHRHEQETRARIQEKLTRARERLDLLEASAEGAKETLRGLEQSTQAAKITLQNIKRKIADALKINDYTEEKQAAIARLEDQVTALNREIKQHSDRIAVAETITNFLTRQSPYDFNVFYAYIQSIKLARERSGSSWPGSLPRMEEKVRTRALKAFKGDLVSRMDYQELQSQNNDLKKGIAQRDQKLEETSRQLEGVTNENRILSAIKLRFEGRPITLAELREWVAQIYDEHIEKRANEKYNLVAAGVSGIIDFVFAHIRKPQERA